MNNHHHIKRRGIMLVMSSPSGAGKTTISRKLLERDANIIMSISATTRRPRPQEEDARDYFFVSQAKFDEILAKDGFLEHACVFDNAYGTPKAPVEEALAKGMDVLFDVDWQGTQQLADNAARDLVSVFILPPSHAELERRLRSRAQDSDEVVKIRMSKASSEMSHWDAYDYIIINSDVEKSVSRVEAILASERLKRKRQTGLANFIRDLC